MPRQLSGVQRTAMEWSYSSAHSYADPFNDVEVDAAITGPRGQQWKVPAFWGGGTEWRVRFAPPEPGTYRCRSACSNAADADLHGQEFALTVRPYDGDNVLLRHGPLRVSKDRRHLEHVDGTPFFWLGDTWWMSLCARIHWPDEFQLMTADRVKQGFSVIQIIAGLYPDMPPFDPRGANEAGYPWTEGYTRINPAYFDMADLRLQHLVHAGLVPCIVGCWAYFASAFTTVQRLKQHWRNLVARYSAFPVVWCLAGEGAMPYYLSKSPEQDAKAQIKAWTEIGRYVRQIDPMHHPVTIHPTDSARNQVEDETVLDIDVLQTGHSSHESMPNTIKVVNDAVARQPTMPVLNSEVCYEGILGRSREEIQRYMFWSCVLRGACGHTYGANGIWQLNRPEKPFGPSPHGGTWGNTPWTEAYRLPGARQVASSKRFLMRFPWTQLQPQPTWVDGHGTPELPMGPVAAGIPGKLRLIYLPAIVAPWGKPVFLRQLESGTRYKASFYDPQSDNQYPIGSVSGDAEGSWRIPGPPVMQDLVLVLEKE